MSLGTESPARTTWVACRPFSKKNSTSEMHLRRYFLKSYLLTKMLKCHCLQIVIIRKMVLGKGSACFTFKIVCAICVAKTLISQDKWLLKIHKSHLVPIWMGGFFLFLFYFFNKNSEVCINLLTGNGCLMSTLVSEHCKRRLVWCPQRG